MSTSWKNCRRCRDNFGSRPELQLRAADINHHDGPEAAAEWLEAQLDHAEHDGDTT